MKHIAHLPGTRLIFFWICLLFSNTTFGQPTTSPVVSDTSGRYRGDWVLFDPPPSSTVLPPPDEILICIDAFEAQKLPVFGESEADLKAYLARNLQCTIRDTSVTGTVVLSVEIDQFGAVRKVQIIWDKGTGCGEEARRVVMSMPPWKPGIHNGRPVGVRLLLPIRFTIE